MSYQVLYRKYRPKTFDEIYGQKVIVDTLKNAITNNKISHAYLFSGPRGTGKTSIAKLFAKTINCKNIINSNPCLSCESCINANSSSDIIEIDAASNNGVDEIREIKNNITIANISMLYKVYIIDEVHMLSTGAFNALLKTLEEPPKNVIFILATTDVQKVPLTIVSRCQRFEFKKISDKDLVNCLKEILIKEKITISDEVLNEIAYLSDGALRDALGYLDQLILNSDKDITLEDFNKTFYLATINNIDRIINAILDNNDKELITQIDTLEVSGINYQDFVYKCLNYFQKKIGNIPFGNFKRIMNILLELSKISSSNGYIKFKMEFLEYIYNNKEKGEKIISREIIPDKKIYESVKNDNEIISREIISVKNLNKNKEIEENNNKIISREIILDKNQLNIELDDVIKSRINNCLILTKKEIREELNKSYNLILEKVNDKKLLNMLIDNKIIVASDDYIIIKTETDSQAGLINNNIKKVDKIFKKKCSAVSNLKWKDILVFYKKNKNDMSLKENVDIVDEKKIDSIAESIFDNEKIESEI